MREEFRREKEKVSGRKILAQMDKELIGVFDNEGRKAVVAKFLSGRDISFQGGHSGTIKIGKVNGVSVDLASRRFLGTNVNDQEQSHPDGSPVNWDINRGLLQRATL